MHMRHFAGSRISSTTALFTYIVIGSIAVSLRSFYSVFAEISASDRYYFLCFSTSLVLITSNDLILAEWL